MTSEQIIRWLPFAFPLLFVGMWLFISTLLGLTTGWFNLQQWYPDDGGEEPLLTLHGQSGAMGWGANLNNCLRLRAYRSGFGIGIWRIVAPFQKPLLIPWGEMKATETRSWFVQMVRLDFGDSPSGSIRISVKSWERLAEAAEQAGVDAVPKLA